MREIKFRAWDKSLERMADHEELKEITQQVVGMYSQSSVKSLPAILVPINKNNVELMQYTGLKDKNGKEIYEGDIIYWKDLSKASDGTLEDNVVVFWDDEHLRWSAESFSTPNECQKLYDYSDVDEIEVIGNIYENQELLV